MFGKKSGVFFGGPLIDRVHEVFAVYDLAGLGHLGYDALILLLESTVMYTFAFAQPHVS